MRRKEGRREGFTQRWLDGWLDECEAVRWFATAE